MKRSPADIAFSKCVRERNDWICEYCNRDFSGNTSILDCSHFYGRRAKSTRWDGDNCFAHCRGCHNKLGENPGEFTNHAIKLRGEGWYERLTEKWRNVKRKISKAEEKEIAKHYREELKKMEKQRKEGVRGWLDFVNYE